jgi:DNA-binding MarR family transcriptional regulator
MYLHINRNRNAAQGAPVLSSKLPSSKRLVTDAREIIARCPGVNIRRAARRVTAFLEARMPSLTVAQFGLMAQIAAATDDTIGGLAAQLGLDQSTLSRNLRTLERDGLVEIVTAEQDLRRRAVWLTETGARRLEAAIAEWRAARDALARDLNLDQALELAHAAARIVG